MGKHYDFLSSLIKIVYKIKKSMPTNNGTVISENADFAEVGEWSDGNPNGEDRIGYFVSVDTSESGKTMVKATTDSDVRGITVYRPGFAANTSADKYDPEGNLLSQFSYVCFAGFASVIDNGLCSVNGRCIPANDGTAQPSPNNLGYQVIERIDDSRVLVLVEPEADMLVRIKEDIIELQNKEILTKDQVYTKDEVYPKDLVYTKDDVYTKDEVYDKTQVYTKDEVYAKDQV